LWIYAASKIAQLLQQQLVMMWLVAVQGRSHRHRLQQQQQQQQGCLVRLAATSCLLLEVLLA
jgi:hypothetical protein